MLGVAPLGVLPLGGIEEVAADAGGATDLVMLAAGIRRRRRRRRAAEKLERTRIAAETREIRAEVAEAREDIAETPLPAPVVAPLRLELRAVVAALPTVDTAAEFAALRREMAVIRAEIDRLRLEQEDEEDDFLLLAA